MSEKIVRKRNKPSLVCGNCKRKKIKCDRKLPCLACVKINSGYECTYGNDDVKHAQQTAPDNSIYWELLKLREKVKELEDIQAKHVPEDVTRTSFGSIPERNGRTDNYNNMDKLSFATHSDTSSTKSPHMSFKETSSRSTRSPHLTYNQSPSTGSNLTPPNNHPIVSYKHFISFYNGYIPIQIKGKIKRANYGPLTVAAMMTRDAWLALHWKHMESQSNLVASACILTRQLPPQTQENDTLYGTTAEPDRNGVMPESTFFKKSLETEGYGEIIPYKSLQKKINAEILSSNKSFNISNLTLARSLFDGRGPSELQLIEKIQSILPSRKVIWCLINRFFRILYPHFPFLDEFEFKSELERILGDENESEDCLRIEKKLDLINVCICLILLRLTYLSLFSNDSSTTEKALESEIDTEEKFLLSNPINLVIIDVARSCVQSLQSTKKYNLTLFQAVLFMRIYTCHAPEEGDGMDGGDSQVKTGLLINMAYLLGFNREPNKFNRNLVRDAKLDNLCRKIWFYLLKADVLQAYMGTPFGTDLNHFDTLPPYLTGELKGNDFTKYASGYGSVGANKPISNSNISNLQMEKEAIDSLNLQNILPPLRDALKIVLDMTQETSVNTMTEALTKIENVCKDLHDKILSQTSIFERVWRVQLYLYYKGFLLSVYYHLYMYYEGLHEAELSYHFIMVNYEMMLKDLMPIFHDILKGELSQYSLILDPVLQATIHKCIQFVLATSMRSCFLAYSMRADKDHQRKLESPHYQQHYQVVEQLSHNTVRAGELMILMFDKLSSCYFYAWRIKKVMRVLFQNAKGESVYKDVPKTTQDLRTLNFSTVQLCKLNDLLIEINGKVDRITSKKNVVPENIFTPTSSEIPLDPSSSEYIDQMWMLMMAMKDTNDQTKFIPEEQALLNTKLRFRSEDADFNAVIDGATPGPASPYLQFEANQFDIFNVFTESSWE